MGKLTAGQMQAIAGGQPVRQSWAIRSPVDAAHSGYITTSIDDGIWAPGATAVRRVTKAGKRTHRVWNPHPQDTRKPQALRYSIECANADGYFHRRSGSCWNPFGLYDAAPAECYLVHRIYVWDAAAGAWSEITHMAYEGRVIKVEYAGTAGMTRRDLGGSSTPQEVPATATITSEQEGAWGALRRVFTADDADVEKVTDGTTGDFYIDFVH